MGFPIRQRALDSSAAISTWQRVGVVRAAGVLITQPAVRIPGPLAKRPGAEIRGGTAMKVAILILMILLTMPGELRACHRRRAMRAAGAPAPVASAASTVPLPPAAPPAMPP